jgi:hypothetical protein
MIKTRNPFIFPLDPPIVTVKNAMPDYDFSGLNSRDFEHLVQALAKKFIAPGVTPFSDGPDGGREAIYEGTMHYPSASGKWSGYLVIQCKFKQQNGLSAKTNASWLSRQLTKEFDAFRDEKKKRRLPSYYLLATNVVLTAKQDTGSKDVIRKRLRDWGSSCGIADTDVWSYDDLCRLLDQCPEIRRTYAGFITSGDVLSKLMDYESLRGRRAEDVVLPFLQKELLDDHAARLESTGVDLEHQTALSTVFVDLPASTREDDLSAEPRKNHHVTYSLRALLTAGAQVLRPSVQKLRMEPNSAKRTVGLFVIVGGPGQGKSTLTQYLCQVCRATILRKLSPERISSRAQPVVASLLAYLDENRLPRVPRIPFRVSLNQYASDLARNADLTILQYFRDQACRRSNATISIDDVKRWLGSALWLFVFDGLDEVPASSNRQEVIKQIEDFLVDSADCDGDVMCVITTRPQSYSSDLLADDFQHWYLTPLNPEQALSYGVRLANSRCGVDDRRRDLIVRRLQQACDTPATSRLMRTPLQVTIMATLVERIGEPPRQRYRLFERYYRTIFDREETREGPLSGILKDRRSDIDVIHYRAGLLLQARSEATGATDSRLADSEFKGLVLARLKELDIPERSGNMLLKQITDVGLDRLVFLVRAVPDYVSFEIRSIQEFMAAEALLAGPEVAVIERLREVAPIIHWRNVFLFATGKCFSEFEHLLDNIYGICVDLNTDAREEYSASAWGSGLALDIIEDGMSIHNPRYHKRFASLALEMLDSGGEKSHTRLVRLYDDDLKDLYVRAIEDRLGHRLWCRRFAAWRLLIGLASRNISWPLRLIDAYWPDDPEEQRLLLEASTQRTFFDWEVDRVVSLIPILSFAELENWKKKRDFPTLKERNIPVWARAAIDWFSHRPDLCVTLSPTGSGDVYFYTFTSAASESLARLQDLLYMERPSDDWRLVISGVRFALAPTAECLVSELRSLVESAALCTDINVLSRLPWPLAECIAGLSGGLSLSAIEKRLKREGQSIIMRSKAAEEGWRAQGVVLDDFAFAANREDDRPVVGEKLAFPFACARLDSDHMWHICQEQAYAGWWNHEYECADAAVAWLGRFLRKLPRGAGRAQVGLEYLLAHSYSGEVALSASESRDVYAEAQAFGKPFLGFFRGPSKFLDSDEWIELLRWLCQKYGQLWELTVQQKDALSVLGKACAGNPQLFCELLPVASACATVGEHWVLPGQVDCFRMSGDVLDMKGFQLLLVLVGADTFESADALERVSWEGCGRRLGQFAGEHGLWPIVCKVADRSRAIDDSIVALALGLLKSDSRAGLSSHVEKGSYMHLLQGLLGKRRSGLTDPGTWKRLKLPSLG